MLCRNASDYLNQSKDNSGNPQRRWCRDTAVRSAILTATSSQSQQQAILGNQYQQAMQPVRLVLGSRIAP
jgi:hypothetical protein